MKKILFFTLLVGICVSCKPDYSFLQHQQSQGETEIPLVITYRNIECENAEIQAAFEQVRKEEHDNWVQLCVNTLNDELKHTGFRVIVGIMEDEYYSGDYYSGDREHPSWFEVRPNIVTEKGFQKVWIDLDNLNPDHRRVFFLYPKEDDSTKDFATCLFDTLEECAEEVGEKMAKNL